MNVRQSRLEESRLQLYPSEAAWSTLMLRNWTLPFEVRSWSLFYSQNFIIKLSLLALYIEQLTCHAVQYNLQHRLVMCNFSTLHILI